jgi:hypothetical protein
MPASPAWRVSVLASLAWPLGGHPAHMAKAMPATPGVPFLFVSATSLQSMWYGMTARKLRAYFKVPRKTAREEGGAIGGRWLEVLSIVKRKDAKAAVRAQLGLHRPLVEALRDALLEREG